MLVIPESEIRRHGPGRALAVLWRQWRAERRLARRGVRFRDTEAHAAAAAYAAMTEEEFCAINGRQDWANWRTIPRALSGHVPDRPLRVLDLGCGAGSSTQVLAFYCPAGSLLSGYEMAEPLLALARRRDYRQRGGESARVDFVCQGITQTLRQTDGRPVPDGSVDLVNASGIVGHHLTPATFVALRAELVRLLGPDGVALLDIGPTLRGVALRPLLTEAGFHYLGHYKSWFWDPTGAMAFSRSGGARLQRA